MQVMPDRMPLGRRETDARIQFGGWIIGIEAKNGLSRDREGNSVPRVSMSFSQSVFNFLISVF